MKESKLNSAKVAILGGGPVGLETLVACQDLGIDAVLYEKGEIGSHVLQWGHVRLFSPFAMNSSKAGVDLLRKAGCTLPGPNALLTGQEYYELYLKPLSQLPSIKDNIQINTNVEYVGRSDLLKGDDIGGTRRSASAFRLLLNSCGQEKVAVAEYVIDCTGTFGQPNWLGSGGIPCPGERAAGEFIDYRLPKVTSMRDVYAGKTTLIVGSGYSAATNVINLAKLSESNPETQIIWLTRHQQPLPITPIENDTLVERDQLTRSANDLALDSQSAVHWQTGTVDSIVRTESGNAVKVFIKSEVKCQTSPVPVQRIIANVGFRPNRQLYEELQVHECYASHGPMKLAAALLGETSADCLAQQSHGIATLKSPEPNFYILGAKSYGRSSRFLIQIGLEQVAAVVSEIEVQLQQS